MGHGALFGGKMGVAATPAPKSLGPQNPTHVEVLLGHLLSQNRVPKLSDPEPPSLPLMKAGQINFLHNTSVRYHIYTIRAHDFIIILIIMINKY